MTEQYDYIIVGAGSAGCVLANRLSQDPSVSVLLIEAGGEDRNLFIHMPRGLVKLIENPEFVWRYEFAGSELRNKPHRLVTGKVLGGSSSVNGMLYFRPQPEDFDDWAALGLAEWNWEKMEPCFQALEDHELGANGFHGAGGPQHVSLHPERQELCEAFIAAGESLGLPRRVDFHRRGESGIGYLPRTIKHGKRFSTAAAFLHPVRSRPNLRVETGLTIDRIVFDGKRATGVAGRRKTEAVAFQGREIIVSAGAIGSPRLLQLSGIGPGALLQRHGIPLVADRAEVGRNLHEHFGIEFRLRVRDGSQNHEFRGWRVLRNVLRQQLFGSGPMSFGAFEVGATLAGAEGATRADTYLHMGPFTTDAVHWDRIEKEPGMFLAVMPARPKSTGKLEINSADPAALPSLSFDYLSHPEDRRVAIDAFRFIRKLLQADALAPYLVSELSPGSEVQSDEEIVDAYRRIGEPGLHPTGSCRMGVDADSVVDARLRVRGVEGLRVADASIMPGQVSANTNAATIAIGWRAAELIAADANRK